MPSPSTSARGVRALIAAASVAAVGISAPAAIAASPSADTASKKTLRLATPDKKPAIVNGQQIPITQVPYQVFVQASVGGGTYSCGGSIYDADTIVTAAHCVIDSTTRAEFLPAQMTVRAGVSDVNPPLDPAEQTAGVTDILVHPYYDYGTNGVAPDDVALLELDTRLDLSGLSAQPIALTAGGPQVAAGTAGYISGYGRQVPGNTQPNGLLYGLDTTVGDPLACGGDATAVVLCLQSQTGSACEGDSGGPLAVTGALVGVASFVTTNGPTGECGINSVNGYVNVAAPEIKQFIENPTVAPPRAPRGGNDVSASGIFRAGSSMTCSPGTWTEAPAFTFTFTDTRNGEVLQSGTSATYAFKDSDVGRTVDCRVAAANAGGTGITRTQASPAIGPDPNPPAPPPPPAPAPRPAPTPTPQPRRPQPRRNQPRRATRRPNVRVSVTAASSRGRSGATMRYTIRVVNRGTAAARRVVVCNDPGRGLAFTRLPRGARKAAGEACWQVGTLRAKSSRTYRLTLRIARTSRTRWLVNSVGVAGANVTGRGDTARIRVQGAQRRTAPPAVTG